MLMLLVHIVIHIQCCRNSIPLGRIIFTIKKLNCCLLPLNPAHSDLSYTNSFSFALRKKAECYQVEDLFHHSTYTLRQNDCFLKTLHFCTSLSALVPAGLAFPRVICVFIAVLSNVFVRAVHFFFVLFSTSACPPRQKICLCLWTLMSQKTTKHI